MRSRRGGVPGDGGLEEDGGAHMRHGRPLLWDVGGGGGVMPGSLITS